MNVNLLITDNNFTVATAISLLQSKPDASSQSAKFFLPPDDKYSQVNNLEKPAADDVSKEIQNREEPVHESQDIFTQSIHKKTKSENANKTESKTKSEEQSTISDRIKQPNKQKTAQNWLAEHLLAVEQGKEYENTKIESKNGRQLAHINTNTPADKSSSVTGHAAKSGEIKLLHATEKGQLGLKTILPAKSNGENGLKSVLPDTAKITPADKKQPEKVNNTDKDSVLPKTLAEIKPAMEREVLLNWCLKSPLIPAKVQTFPV